MKMFEYLADHLGRVSRVLTRNYYLDSGGTIRHVVPKVRGKRARHIDKINRFNAKVDSK